MFRPSSFLLGLLVLVICLPMGCRTGPGVHRKTEQREIILQERVDYRIVEETAREVVIEGKVIRELAQGTLFVSREGYRAYDWQLKLLEFFVFAPLSFVFYPIPIIIPIAFYNPYALAFPWLLLNPFATVLPGSRRVYPDENILHETWSRFTERTEVKPWTEGAFQVTFVPTSTVKTFSADDKGRVVISLDKVVPRDFSGKEGKVVIRSRDGRKSYYFTLDEKQLLAIRHTR